MEQDVKRDNARLTTLNSNNQTFIHSSSLLQDLMIDVETHDGKVDEAVEDVDTYGQFRSVHER